MDQMPLSAVIFYSIPESIILFSFGMAVVGEYINFKRIFIASIISAFASMLARAYVPYFGLHTIVGILVLFLLFWKMLNLKPWKAAISSLISLMVLALLETTIAATILKKQNLLLKELWKDNLKRIIYCYPHLIVYGLITWFLYSKKKFLIRGSRVGNYDEYNKVHLIPTLMILFQGMFLVIINEYFIYYGKYLCFIELAYIIIFILSILFLKFLYSNDKLKLKKAIQNRDES